VHALRATLGLHSMFWVITMPILGWNALTGVTVIEILGNVCVILISTTDLLVKETDALTIAADEENVFQSVFLRSARATITHCHGMQTRYTDAIVTLATADLIALRRSVPLVLIH